MPKRWKVVRRWEGNASKLVPQVVMRTWTRRRAASMADRFNASNRVPGQWYEVGRIGADGENQ